MKKALLLIISFFAYVAVDAQSLTIESAVQLARENYPALAQYRLLERSTSFSLNNASKAWLPQGGVSAQLTWQNDVAALPEMLTDIMTSRGLDYPGLSKTQYKAGIDVQQHIWDGGKIAASRQTTRAAAEVERSNLDVQMYDVEGRVEEIYFGMLLLDENIRRANATISLVDSTLQQMRSMKANGVATQSDCDQVEARLLSTRQQLTRLKSSRAAFARMLAIFIGESVDNRRLEMPEFPALKDMVRPQLKLFDSQIAHISAQEAGVRASVMPTVGAFISTYYGYPGYNMFKNMQSHNPNFNFLVGIRLSWNFSSIYTRSNSLHKLQVMRQQVEANRALYLFNSEIAQSDVLGQIDALQQHMRDDERIMELRRSIVKVSQSQLRNGIIDTTSLLSKITDMELAENDFTTHRIQLTQALYKLNHIRNK